MMGLDLNLIESLTGGRLCTHDVPCPLCGPSKRRTTSQRKPVLRIWRSEPAFATYHCARCGEKGYVRDGKRLKMQLISRRNPNSAPTQEKGFKLRRLLKRRGNPARLPARRVIKGLRSKDATSSF
jgi:hypothetical protein